MSEQSRPLLRVLTGCTAVGKTELALAWAERNNAEILSCDSLLFYKGMDIGTAKPSAKERSRVPHHLIDTNELCDQMDVTRYVRQAVDCAKKLSDQGKNILVTGGSGFYLRSFFSPVADDIEVSEAIRSQARELSQSEALLRLRGLNPEGLGNLDVLNPRRVTRALERCLASGRTILELANEFAAKPCAFAAWDVRLIELQRAPACLEQRIRHRVDEMLNAGLVAEVRSLDSAGLRNNPSAAKAIGYREVLEFLDGALAAEELAARIIANTKALVRKQRTWFRTQVPAHLCVDPETLCADTLPW